MAQLDMFGAAPLVPPSVSGDPDRVRRKLQALLDEAREAGPHGLPVSRRRLMETLVPQMTRWLPEEEAESLKNSFKSVLAA